MEALERLVAGWFEEAAGQQVTVFSDMDQPQLWLLYLRPSAEHPGHWHVQFHELPGMVTETRRPVSLHGVTRYLALFGLRPKTLSGLTVGFGDLISGESH